MNIRRQLSAQLALHSVVVLAMTGAAVAGSGETAAEKIARAMTAAPADISAAAAVVDVDGTVLREGSNSWVCLPGIPLMPGDEHPMCNDPVWMKWIDAAANGREFTTDVIGVSYMLAGDALVSNSNPMATDPNNGDIWVQDGPHVMVLFPDNGVLDDLPRDPFAGGPYVMWDGTPLVHVMLPFEAK